MNNIIGKNLFGENVVHNKLPRTQYLGSKQRLAEWIFKHAPSNVECIFDAFSGTSSVGYFFKLNGKKVIGNDFLKFNYHIGKALIEKTCNYFISNNSRKFYQPSEGFTG